MALSFQDEQGCREIWCVRDSGGHAAADVVCGVVCMNVRGASLSVSTFPSIASYHSPIIPCSPSFPSRDKLVSVQGRFHSDYRAFEAIEGVFEGVGAAAAAGTHRP